MWWCYDRFPSGTQLGQGLHVSFWKDHLIRKCGRHIFNLLLSTEHVKKLKKYIHKQLKNIALTSEIEGNSSLSFLDIKIGCESNKFVISIYRKPTLSRGFTHFESFTTKSCKSSLIDTLVINTLGDLVYAPIWNIYIRKLVLWS